MASQITNISTVCSAVCSCAHQIEIRVTGLCEGNPPVNPPHKRLVTRKMFPFHGVILISDNDTHVDRSNKDLLWNFTFIFRFLEAKTKNKFLHKTRIPIFTQCWEELCISYYISLFFFLRTNELSEEQWFCASFQSIFSYHDDVIKWKHFPRYWPFVRGNYRSPLWCFLWSAPWINSWVNNRETGDLRRHRTYYDVIVMSCKWYIYRIERTLYI